VLEDASSLKPKLSSRDKQKLDEYLTSVREIEQRVELAEKSARPRPTAKAGCPP
jgi:ribosomal protein S10